MLREGVVARFKYCTVVCLKREKEIQTVSSRTSGVLVDI
jgi:hypothetical protein